MFVVEGRWCPGKLKQAMSLFVAASTLVVGGQVLASSILDSKESQIPRGASIPATPLPAPWGARCLLPPVKGSIVRFFRAPDCPYCAGHRTLDFTVITGQEVRSPIAGKVHFVGYVAGVGYLTVVPDGAPSHLVTVGGLIPARLPTSVASGDLIGTAQGPDVVRLSVRHGQASGSTTYLDPEPFLVRWRVRARLIEAPFDAAQFENSPPRRPGRAEYACKVPRLAVQGLDPTIAIGASGSESR